VKLPRDLSGKDLIKALERIGYATTRQTGSHVRLTLTNPDPHHLTVPNHSPLKVGTLSAILAEAAGHLKITRDQLLERLFK
jgi:predicted RNA binding protein YcfA (HicA-like mRNA interferase family)